MLPKVISHILPSIPSKLQVPAGTLVRGNIIVLSEAIEVCRIARTLHGLNYRRRQSQGFQTVPIEALKPSAKFSWECVGDSLTKSVNLLVFLDVLDSTALIAQSF